MANTLRFKRGLASGIPTGVAGEPLFTTDTFDLYIGNGATNTRFQKYIASGTTSQYLRGDGSLATFPSLTGFVPYTGATANVDLGVYTLLAQNATIASSGSGNTATITHSSGSGIALNITKGGNGEGLYINKTGGSGNAATIIGTLRATNLGIGIDAGLFTNNSVISIGGTNGTFYRAYTGSTETFRIQTTSTTTNIQSFSGNIRFDAGAVSNAMTLFSTGNLVVASTGDTGEKLQVNGTAKITGAATITGNLTVDTNTLFVDATNDRVGIGTVSPQAQLDISTTVSATGAILRLSNQSNTILADQPHGTIQFFSGDNSAPADSVVSSIISAQATTSPNQAYLSFLTGNNTEKMRLTATGRLHIGTFSSDSGELLQVNGTAKITGDATFGGSLSVSDGTSTLRLVNASGLGLFGTLGSHPLVFRTNNTERMRISPTGDLLIGLTSNFTGGPKVYINKPTASEEIFRVDGISGSYGIVIKNTTTTTQAVIGGNLGIGTASPSEKLHVVGNGLITGNLTVDTNTLFVDATNNAVILGSTSNSGELLQVNGTAKITGQTDFGNAVLVSGALAAHQTSKGVLEYNSNKVAIRAYGATAGTGYIAFNTGGGGGSADTERMVIDASGNVTISTNLVLNGTSIEQNNASGLTLNASNASGAILFRTAGSERMSIAANGNLAVDTNTLFVDATNNRVGIGTAVPLVTNHIDGTFRVTSSYTTTVLGTDSNRNVLINSGATGASAVATLVIGTGTAPTSSPSDLIQIYSADVVAGNAAPHFRTENGAVIKLYQETTAVGNSTISIGGGSAVLDDTEFGGYTLRQVVKALQNQGILA
jgi:hypothetical protein